MLREEGWTVRGTSRSRAGAKAIEEAGIEPALADPLRIGSLLDLVGDVSVVVWLMGSAEGQPEQVADINGPRLEHLLRKLVDTPVRGVVYEAVGRVDPEVLEAGARTVLAASKTWSLPAVVFDASPEGPEGWAEAMRDAVLRVAA
jgi:hypothetical protein